MGMVLHKNGHVDSSFLQRKGLGMLMSEARDNMYYTHFNSDTLVHFLTERLTVQRLFCSLVPTPKFTLKLWEWSWDEASGIDYIGEGNITYRVPINKKKFGQPMMKPMM